MIKKDLKLKGSKVLLRKVKITDVNENYHRWMNDPEVNKYMETRFRPQSIEDIKTYVQKMNDDPNTFFMAIMYKKKNRHIGNIKLGPMSMAHQRSEISFWIGDKALWGQGLATEAVSLLTQFGLNELKLKKITAGCYSSNLGSKRVFEKAGYKLECVLKRHYFCDNEMVDGLCFCKFGGS